MPLVMFCWRCQMELPMLTEQEWAEVEPLLNRAFQDMHDYRELHQVGLKEAKDKALGLSALAKYNGEFRNEVQF